MSGLSNLTSLYLGSNQITDIKPLSGLSQKTSLDLGGNNITNCQVLPVKFRDNCSPN
ncbi:MAG TPA: leucine-rich repeat domain-containing protein [Allocoleopsis sp.]